MPYIYSLGRGVILCLDLSGCCAHLACRFDKIVYVWMVVVGCRSLLMELVVLEVDVLVYQVY